MLGGTLDFLSMATVLLRIKLSPSALVVLLVLQLDDSGMETYEIMRMGGLSQTVAYRTLRYLRSKGIAEERQLKDAYRRVVRVWRLTAEGRELAARLDGLYRRVVREWERRWNVQRGGRTDG